MEFSVYCEFKHKASFHPPGFSFFEGEEGLGDIYSEKAKP